MLTLEILKTEVDGLRETCRMTDSDAVETRQLLKVQTSTLNALRADQIGLRGLMDQQARTLAEQGIGIGNLVISVNQTQQEIHNLRSDVAGLKVDVFSLKGDVTGLKADVTGLQLNVYELKADVKDLKNDMKVMHKRLDRMETRLDGIEIRLGRLEERQDRTDRNIVAIMRHLGVEPDES